ncbi:hypothetical protein CHU98_g4841 [Xylaria longipes]|nr:hypothetical protein CHU98_g4841 [Xylaria longipes]
MARKKPGAQKPYQTLTYFKFLVGQMQRKLKAEGQGRHQELDAEMAKQFRVVVGEMEHKPRGRSLFDFSWRVFEGVSNHFWPGSVTPEDRPSTTQETSRPLICVHRFAVLDTYAMSSEQLVDFIECNGEGPSKWPKKSKFQKRLERDAKKEQQLRKKLEQPGDHVSNPIVISPVRNTIPRSPIAFDIPKKTDSSTLLRPPLLAFSTSNKTYSSPPPPTAKIHDITNIPSPSLALWDEDIEMVDASPLGKSCVTSKRPPNPKLSVVCQPGWDLNNKAIWIPAGGIKCDENIVPSQAINAQPLGPVEPSIGTVSFTFEARGGHVQVYPKIDL